MGNRILRTIFKGTLMLLLSFSSTLLLAQTITVDGNPADWPAVLNSNTNTIIKTFVHDAAETNDDQFTQGTSDVDPVEQWHWNIGQTNNKGDILNTGVALIGGKLFFFGDRFAVNGDAQIGFWFFHNNVAPITGGTFSGTHAVGDLLVLSNFTNGGGAVNIAVFEWVGSGGDIGGGVLQSIAVGGKGGAFVNNQNFNVPTTVTGWNYQSKFGAAGVYVTGSFFEGFIDLTAIGANPCFQNFLMETRNSQSVTSSRQDMAAGAFKTLPTVSLTVNLTTGVTQGSPQAGCPKLFNINALVATSAGLTATGANTFTWTITKSDGTAIGNEVTFVGNANGTATFTINSITAAQFVYRVIATGSNAPGCTAVDTVCIAITSSAPPCNISGPNPVCPKSTNSYIYDPDGDGIADPIPANFTAAWSLVSNSNSATLNPPTNGDSVTVTAGSVCNTGFRLKLTFTSTSGLVTFNCTDSITVNVKSDLTLTCPKDTTLQCGDPTGPGTTGTANARDNGCGVKISYTDVITRTWTATDACGNTKTCTQKISVPGPCVTSNTIPDPPAARVVTSVPKLLSPVGAQTGTNQTVKTTDKPAPLTPAVTSIGSGLKVQAFPNPFSNTINFRFTSEVSGRAILEVFNTMGQRIGIAYDGTVDAGVMKYVQFTTRLTNQSLIYRLKVGTKMVRGTVLELNK